MVQGTVGSQLHITLRLRLTKFCIENERLKRATMMKIPQVGF